MIAAPFARAPFAGGLRVTAGATFLYTGSTQTWTVPIGVNLVTVDLMGAAGGTPNGAGLGGRVRCNLVVIPGETLQIRVGGLGVGKAGGYNGGGPVTGGTGTYGAGGGGATDVRRGAYASADRLVVAPGGGGGGAYGSGGAGGTPNGSTGGSATPGSSGGGGGTATAGGAAGTMTNSGTAGTLAQGGTGGTVGGIMDGGGGGGGLYGGGGGGGSNGNPGDFQGSTGGGGGSGYSTGVAETIQSGVREGNGMANITWLIPFYNLAGTVTPAGTFALTLRPWYRPAAAASPKMQYDRDGSVGFYRNGSAVLRALTSPELTNLNSESGLDTVVDTTASGTGVTIGVIFPAPRDITGFWTNALAGSANGLLETSTNTTTGIDGSWTTQASTYASSGNFRTGIAALALTGINAIRITSTNGASGKTFYRNLHVYGIPSTGYSIDRLRIWHPTLDQELATLDFGDPAGESTYDTTFRVKNNSSSLYANSVVLSAEALTDANPTVVSQLTVSQGGSFAATQTLTQLGPGAISAVCTLRLSVSASVLPGLWRQRLKAVATTWTTS